MKKSMRWHTASITALAFSICMVLPAFGAHAWTRAHAEKFISSSVKKWGQYTCNVAATNFEYSQSISFSGGTVRLHQNSSVGSSLLSSMNSTVALSNLSLTKSDMAGMNGWLTRGAVPQSALVPETASCTDTVSIVMVCIGSQCATTRYSGEGAPPDEVNGAFEFRLTDDAAARKVLAAFDCLIPQGNACPSD